MNCPRCQDRGFLAYDVAPGHPLFGKVTPCACALQAKRTELFSGLWAAMSLDTFRPLTADERTALRAAQGLAAAWTRGEHASLVLYAPLRAETQRFPDYAEPQPVTGCGCGKTHLAVSLAKLALDAGHDVKLTTETELLRDIRRSYGDDAELSEAAILDAIGSAWLLVLDDIGTSAVKSLRWYQDILYAIVNRRYTAYWPVIITTNLTPDQLAERLGTRTWSRIQALATCIRLDGPDRRQMAAP